MREHWRTRILVAAVLMALMGAATASASHIAGIRATLVSQAGPDVTIDVTGYADYTYAFSTLFIGANTFFGSPLVPAIDWGDGSTVPAFGYGPSTGIPQVATSTVINGINVDVYRGSFSHTYPDTSPYTITVFSTVNPGTPYSTGYQLVTGNILPVTYGTGTVNYVVTNTLTTGAAEEIPTASEAGLLALALLLAGLGIFQLRRA